MSHESDTPVSTSDLMHHSAPEEGATPETDAVIVGGTIGQLALLEHARALERRLAAVTKERDALMSMAMRERTQP